jgi:hypothetical protein
LPSFAIFGDCEACLKPGFCQEGIKNDMQLLFFLFLIGLQPTSEKGYAFFFLVFPAWQNFRKIPLGFFLPEIPARLWHLYFRECA